MDWSETSTHKIGKKRTVSKRHQKKLAEKAKLLTAVAEKLSGTSSQIHLVYIERKSTPNYK
jgi:hypothetical protein